ncbi:MAG: ABC transporter ATP-binding protein, partial [Tistrella sp.]|nr:ABC transporter ATP-binding protein [Tistrella sp.]
MALIDLDHIRHSYGPAPKSDDDYALKEVHHRWDDGGAYALLGPSGCGKTTLLNIISGLLRPSEGRILFDGRDVTGLSTEERNIAQVFQFPVVYDTMTVYDNLAFPLRNRGVPEREVDARVREILEMIDLADRAKKKARGLTADLKQKISLGRGLVRNDVSAILFDEPLTVIDPHMKWMLRTQLKQLHKRFGHTMIYVTHDQTEALTFADKVVVMHDGRVVQMGTPQELFERPEHTFVGYFIGSPGMNVLDARVDGATARVGDHALPLAHVYPAQAGRVQIGIRPEF